MHCTPESISCTCGGADLMSSWLALVNPSTAWAEWEMCLNPTWKLSNSQAFFYLIHFKCLLVTSFAGAWSTNHLTVVRNTSENMFLCRNTHGWLQKPCAPLSSFCFVPEIPLWEGQGVSGVRVSQLDDTTHQASPTHSHPGPDQRGRWNGDTGGDVSGASPRECPARRHPHFWLAGGKRQESRFVVLHVVPLTFYIRWALSNHGLCVVESKSRVLGVV